MKLSKLKVGDVIVADNSFTCLEAGEHVVQFHKGNPFVICAGEAPSPGYTERHYLEGQCENSDHMIGISKPKKHIIFVDTTKTDIEFLENAMGVLSDDEDSNGALAQKWAKIFRKMRLAIEDDGA